MEQTGETMKKKGPFDLVIDLLRNGKWVQQAQCNRAANVLEAAGKVDKDEAQTFLRAWYEENGLKVPGEREAYNHIRRFLDALPDEEPK